MNKHTFILGIFFLSAFASCRKDDLKPNIIGENPAGAQAQESAAFKSISQWNEAPQGNNTSYDANISGVTIGQDDLREGLVLVYMKRGSQVNALPFNEKGNNEIYWHYQVSGNNIQINGEAKGNADVKQPGFTWFVLSQDKIKTLEGQGYSKADLMSLTYEKANSLFN